MVVVRTLEALLPANTGQSCELINDFHWLDVDYVKVKHYLIEAKMKF